MAGSAARYPAVPPGIAVIVTARDEADRLGDTLAGLAEAFPAARVLVADDASSDATPEATLRAGAQLVRAPRRLGKGGAATLAARALLAEAGEPALVVLCDGDLGLSARELPALVEALGRADLAVASFAQRVGGGFGIAVGFARAAVRRLTGLELEAPLSGQRALRPAVLAAVVPFAHGFGMEVGMTVDAHRAGFHVVEVELELEHRATGRDAAGFAHRARQLADIARAAVARVGSRA
jgi:glycosyltransferase involved in cell wall biosynthesis